jgi:hypothetical protein
MVYSSWSPTKTINFVICLRPIAIEYVKIISNVLLSQEYNAEV